MIGEDGALVLADGRRLTVLSSALDYEYETVRTDRPAPVPDLSWRLVPSGEHPCLHVHRWQTDDERGGQGPRLVWYARRVIEHVPCNGLCGLGDDCEGYDVVRWLCPVTETYIEPGTRPGPSSATFMASEILTLTVDATEVGMIETIKGARAEWTAEHDGKPLHCYMLLPTLRRTGSTYQAGAMTADYAGGPMPREVSP